MLTRYVEIESDQFMYFRDGGEPTIMENLDPVQFMIPAPKTSKLVPDLEKSKSIVILNEILNAAASTIKDKKDLLKLRKE